MKPHIHLFASRFLTVLTISVLFLISKLIPGARGLFAGIDLSSFVVTQDKDETRIMYGKFVQFDDILAGKMRRTGMSHPFLSAVSKYTGEKKSESRPPVDIPRRSDRFYYHLAKSNRSAGYAPTDRFLSCAIANCQRCHFLPSLELISEFPCPYLE